MPAKKTKADLLGREFFVQAASVMWTENTKFLYTNVMAMLREELEDRDANTLDYMLAERIAATYAIIRERENQAQISGTALSYSDVRQINQDWANLAMSIKKLWTGDKDDKASELVLKKVSKALSTTIDSLPEGIKDVVRKELAEGLEVAGF